MKRLLQALLPGLALVLLMACAAPAPESTPTPAPTSTPTPAPELVRTQDDTALYWHTPEGQAVLEVHFYTSGIQDLRQDPSWPEVQAQLAPENEDFDLEDMAQLALDHYREDPAAFEDVGWQLFCYAGIWDDGGGKLPYFPFWCHTLYLDARGKSYDWFRSGFTDQDGEPCVFADLFTVDRETAAARVLEGVLEHNALLPEDECQDPEVLTAAFDPERILPMQDGLYIWYPYTELPNLPDGLSVHKEYTIRLEDLADIMAPVSPTPLWVIDGERNFFVLNADGQVENIGEDFDRWFYGGDVHLLCTELVQQRMIFTRHNPALAAIQARYDAEADALRAFYSRQADKRAELYWAADETGRNHFSYASSNAVQWGHNACGRYIVITQDISLGGIDWGKGGMSWGNSVYSHEVYDVETGEQLAFRDLFDDPDRAEQLAADYMQKHGHAPEQIASALEPYSFSLTDDGTITLYGRSPHAPEPVEAELLSELEGLGFHYICSSKNAEDESCEIPPQVFADCGPRFPIQNTSDTLS